jgi:hypothetical protein
MRTLHHGGTEERRNFLRKPIDLRVLRVLRGGEL